MRIIKLIAVFSVLLTATISCWLHTDASNRRGHHSFLLSEAVMVAPEVLACSFTGI